MTSNWLRWSPSLLGVVVALVFLIFADSWFDGRARSLIFPQVALLGVALSIQAVIRRRWASTRPWRRDAIELVATFYACWLAFYWLWNLLFPAPE